MAAAEEDDDAHIIASVRRILGEDVARGSGRPELSAGGGEVFQLEPGMMVEPGRTDPAATPPRADEALSPDMAAWASEWAEDESAATPSVAEPVATRTAPPLPPEAPHPARDADGPPVTPAPAAAAAGRSFGSLRDTVRAQREAAVAEPATLSIVSHGGGPTVEQMIREELRPLLAGWLDAHLPAMVERLVRAEIARIAGENDAGG